MHVHITACNPLTNCIRVKKRLIGDGEMALEGRTRVLKVRGLGFKFQHSGKYLDMAMCVCNSSVLGVETGGFLGAQ